MHEKYLYSLEDRTLRNDGGNKAKNLQFLIRKKYPVPRGWVVRFSAQTDYKKGKDHVIETIRSELKSYIHPEKFYAVRSSASVEDYNEFSCAGLFQSYLSIQGEDEILEAIIKVWQSLYEEKLLTYCNTHGIDTQSILMAVIIQEMVEAKSSGVIFTKNPITGFSEIIIEAGEGIVDQMEEVRSPERWVSKWGNWMEKPKSRIISENFAEELIEKAHHIAKDYGKPVDIEWAYDGEKLYFLQVRPITKLSIPIYSNRITKEMLPGIIKPLVWSVNTTMINKIWAEILIKLTGDTTINPHSLTGYYYGRAYFNMALFGQVFESMGIPYEGLELLLGIEQDGPKKPHIKPGMKIMGRVPSLMSLTRSFLTAEKRYRQMEPHKRSVYDEISRNIIESRSKEDDLLLARKIAKETENVAYFNIVLPMEMMMYHRMLANSLKKEGYDIKGVRLHGVEEAARAYSPNYHLAGMRRKYPMPLSVLNDGEKKSLDDDVEAFLKKFGHFSDSGNDCSKVPWRETPSLIYAMIEMAVEPGGSEKPLEFHDLRLPFMKRVYYRALYKRTSRFAALRESISSLYTFGYGQFRNIFVKMGRDFVEEGLLDHQEDIYYLYWDELVEIVEERKEMPLKKMVTERKKELLHYEHIHVPEIIIGKEQPPLNDDVKEDYKGVPTSLGVYSGPARVLHGFSDFERLLEGDVLIIPFSDVGWSPLFARAGAVIAESGGILSHSSIVAREYRIPAVVSVPGATRIRDGVIVTVDGYSGNIFVEEG